MPSSPRIFHARPPPSSCPSTLLLVSFSLLFGLSGFLFAIYTTNSTCRAPVKSVRVVWEPITAADHHRDGYQTPRRHKVMGFVGIQTGFASVRRRASLRKTWMPSDPESLQRLEEATGLAIRFVIGKSKDEAKMAELRKEVARYDDFLLLDFEEEYNKLPYKTLAFSKAAYALYDSEFYVKADDDIYLRPDRLSTLLAKERCHSQTCIGCMKKGPVFRDPKIKWYEPRAYMLGSEYFLHAYGPLYALSADVVASLIALRNNSFRLFKNEDVTIGAWMLAMNVNHENKKALCSPVCTSSSIAVWDIPKCSGLCNPEKKLLELHQLDICSKSPTMESDVV